MQNHLQRIVVYESQNQLQQFIDDARAHKNLNKKIYFGIIGDETADFIKQNTGVDVSNCNVSLRADNIIKIFNDHGTELTELPRGQRPITDQDILKLPQLLGSIDYAVNAGVYTGMGKDGNSVFLNLRSNLDDSITIGAFKQGKHLDLRIHTMYAKRGNYATTADAYAPASTSETRSGKVSSTISISTPNENVKFSLKEPVEETKDLIAVHNITEENLIKSMDLGGFPMPSIAVMKAQQADANADYGDISVVFRKDTIDPEVNRSNKVYGGDAWTPRFPKIEYEIDYDQASNIYSRAHELSKTKAAFTKAVSLHPDNIEDSVNRLGIERYIENLKSDYTLKQLYLLEHGGQPVEMQQREERAEVSEADAAL